MNQIFLQVLTGLQLGAIFVLIALGLTLIFGTLGVVNFAHGALFMLGAYIAVILAGKLGFVTAILVVPLALFAIGLLMERGLVKHFYDRPHTDQILVTFGLAIVVQEALKWYFGANNIPFAEPAWGTGQTIFYGTGVTVPDPIPGLRIYMPFIEGFVFYPKWRLILILVSMSTVAGLFVLLQFTRFGLVVRAGMRDSEMLRFLGINISKRFAVVFGLGSAIAGIAGVFGGPVTQVDPAVGMSMLVPSFLVVVIGGMGSLPGAVLASIMIGMAMAFSVNVAWLSQIVVYLVAVAVLLIRPRGLLGQKGLME